MLNGGCALQIPYLSGCLVLNCLLHSLQINFIIIIIIIIVIVLLGFQNLSIQTSDHLAVYSITAMPTLTHLNSLSHQNAADTLSLQCLLQSLLKTLYWKNY